MDNPQDGSDQRADNNPAKTEAGRKQHVECRNNRLTKMNGRRPPKYEGKKPATPSVLTNDDNP